MPRIGSPITELRDSKIYKLVANILTLVMFLNISIPAYAVTNANEVEDYLEGSGRYEFSAQDLDPVFKSIFTSNASFIFDGFGYFYEQVVAHNSDAFENVKLVPINVSDITIFVPAIPSKPLYIGTPYVERGILKNQLYQLLNKSWISVNNGGYSDFNELTKDLYDNAQKLITNKQFKFGQNLTQAQIDNLSEDVIWPEKRTLRSGKSVYIPLVYLSKATIASNKLVGSQFSFNNADINTKNFVVNGVSIEARRNLIINTLNNFTAIANGKVIAGGDLTINSGNELSNLSSKISGQTVTLTAHKLTNNTLVSRYDYDYGHGFSELFDTLGVIESIGDLNIKTSGDLISHGGQFDTQASMRIVSGGDVILRTQQANNERYQSGDGWTDSEKSLVNLQTQLSAIDLLSITASNSIISHGAIIKSEGILELLADKGITIIPAEDIYSSSKSFDTSGSGVFGSDESESEDLKRATIVRSLLKAGNSMVLKTEQGNIVLKAVAVDTLGAAKLIAEHGDIQLLISRHAESSDYKKSYEGSLSYRRQGHGYYREKAYYNEFVTSGGLMLDAFNGVRIEYAGHADDLDKTIEELAHSPELAWMKDIRDRSQSGEIDPAIWENVELIMNEWDYDDSGLSPAAMAIIAVIVSIVTYGAGAAIVGTVGGAFNGAMVAAVQAGVTGLTNQVTTSLLGNGFDLSATLKELESSDTVKKLATSMVTAGVISGIDTTLFDGYINIDDPSILAQSAQVVTHAALNATVPLLINGESFDDFGEIFLNGVAISAVNILGQKLANKIGLAASSKDVNGNIKDIEIDIVTKYILHAGLGCTLGTLTTSINGSNSSDIKDGCYSGAAGGVVGEYIASTYDEYIASQDPESEAFIAEVLNDIKSGKGNVTKQNYIDEVLKLKQRGVDISRLIAGISVFAFGGNVDVAIDAGGNAAENNALQFLLLLLISEESLAILAALMFADQATDWVIAAPEAYASVAEIYDLSQSDDLDDQAQAKEMLVDFAIQTGEAMIIEGIEGVLLSKIKLLDKPLEELVYLVSNNLKRLKKTDSSRAFDDLGDSLNPNDYIPSNENVFKNGTTGNWSKELNNPLPNKTYNMESEISFVTDSYSRTITVDVPNLTVNKANDRSKYATIVAGKRHGRKDRLDTDVGGHLIARYFDGAGEGINIVPMDAALNSRKIGLGKYGQLEKQWEDHLKIEGNSVKINIKIKYDGDSTRPSQFIIEQTLKSPSGDTFKLTKLWNKPGG